MNRRENDNFRKKVFEAVKKIPKGKVSTYGQVALLLGKPRGAREVGWPFANAQGKMLFARAVGNALHSNTDPRVPCHRVVDGTGRACAKFWRSFALELWSPLEVPLCGTKWGIRWDSRAAKKIGK